MTFLKKNWLAFVVVFALLIFIEPALCFLMLGGLFVWIGISAMRFLSEVKDKGVKYTGKIVGYETDSDGDKTPVIEFTTPDGTLVSATPFVYASTDMNRFISREDTLNQDIEVLYDPEEPQKFVIAGEKEGNCAVFVLLILAGLFFAGLALRQLLAN